jgi:hypothetical protein
LSEDEADGLGATDCAAGLAFCDTETGGRLCADLSVNVLNCGACGNACPANAPICSGGLCVASDDAGPIQNCAPPFAVCGDACVDTSSDARNCSACGLACGTDEVCSSALCVPTGGGGGCLTGLTSCGPTCANLQTDSLNCGACGVVCAPGETCQQGACAATTTNAPALGCDAGLTDCGGSCVDLTSDNNNCGACGNACGEGMYCNSFGECDPSGGGGTITTPVCAEGLTYCGGACVDLGSDPNNCGGCGAGCEGGGGTCVGGTLVGC